MTRTAFESNKIESKNPLKNILFVLFCLLKWLSIESTFYR